MLQGYGFGRALAIFIHQDELDVHGICVAQRDRGLHPLEENVERTAKGVGPGVKLAEILHASIILQWL